MIKKMTGFPSLAKLNLGQNKIDNTSIFQKALLVLQELHLDGNPLIDPVIPSEFMSQLLQAFKNLILFNG